ncbi:response regulator transcription factor [Maribacter halichondriae]|uniref:response regulator transcription factor n=1 Tax=Maribacter halichondriae TaxID=2980554 RepID=UPI002358CE26|nr:response regulator transcription factor [Maribacter sp. Hal144]
MKRTLFIFTTLIIALLGLFKLSTYAYAYGDSSIEPIIALIAIVFFLIGLYLNKNGLQKNMPEKPPLAPKKLKELGLSKREFEVLDGIVSGLSNKEIGERLFLSESTIKTHVSNLFVKLNAKRRTQAIQKAKEMQLI